MLPRCFSECFTRLHLRISLDIGPNCTSRTLASHPALSIFSRSSGTYGCIFFLIRDVLFLWVGTGDWRLLSCIRTRGIITSFTEDVAESNPSGDFFPSDDMAQLIPGEAATMSQWTDCSLTQKVFSVMHQLSRYSLSSPIYARADS